MCIRDSFISLEQEDEMCTSCLQSAPPGHGPSNSEHSLISHLQLRMSKSLSNVAMKVSFSSSFPLPSDMFFGLFPVFFYLLQYCDSNLKLAPQNNTFQAILDKYPLQEWQLGNF